MRFVSFLAGVALAGWAQFLLVYPARAPAYDSPWAVIGHPFRLLLGETLTHWTAMALSAFSAGTILIALSVGLSPRPESSSDVAPATEPVRGRELPGWMCAPLVALALLPIGWSTRYRGLAAWAAGLAICFALAWRVDRRRGTRLANPFDRREWAALVLLTGAALLWLGHDLGDWRWSGIPDESRFFETAKSIAEGSSGMFLLSEKGVFGYHPVLCSLYQALFLRLFGAGAFGWRMSSAFALAITLPCVYLLGRELFGRRGGCIAALLLGATPLAVGFAHLGYDNIQVLPILGASLALVAWSVRCRSAAGMFLAGCVAGLGWFTYYPARIVVLLAVALARGLGGLTLGRGGRATAVALLGGAVLVVLPLLLRPEQVVRHMLAQTYMGAEGVAPNFGGGDLLRSAGHWVLSLFYGIWARESHLQVNPMLDPITATASIAGLWLSATAFARGRRIGFLAFAYVLSALLVGGFSQYDTPPITRLLFLTPISALLAGFAIERGLSRLEAGKAGRRLAVNAVGVAIVGVGIAAAAADVRYQSQVRFHGYGDGTTSELVRFVATLPREAAIVYVQRIDTYMADVDVIAPEYGFGDRFTYVRRFDWNAEALLARAKSPVAIFLELRDADEKRLAELLVQHHFPGVEWADTDPGRPWSLRWISVPARGAHVEESPDLGAACS